MLRGQAGLKGGGRWEAARQASTAMLPASAGLGCLHLPSLAEWLFLRRVGLTLAWRASARSPRPGWLTAPKYFIAEMQGSEGLPARRRASIALVSWLG